MKFLYLFLFVNAFADPFVGDYVQYDLKMYTGPIVTNRSFYDQELMKIDGDNFFVDQHYTQSNGSDDDSTLKFSSKDFVTREKAIEILDQCSAQGGSLENVKVPAGKFTACKMTTKEEGDTVHTWYYPIPMWGILKVETIASDVPGLRYVKELRKFKSGN